MTQIAPGAGHIAHMSGHIYWGVGDYPMAAKVNEQAVQADRDYIRLTGVRNSLYLDAYYSHNLHFIARASAEIGRYEEAKAAADQLAEHVPSAYSRMPGMVDAFLPTPFQVPLRFGRWDDVLRYPKPDPRMTMSIALWHYARAVAFNAKGDQKSALQERDEFAKANPAVRTDMEFFFNPAGKIVEVAAAVLEARLAPDNTHAIPLWQQAVALQDALMHDDPPAWDYPIRESLGATLLRTGRKAEAEAVFRENLRLNPRDPRGLFGLWESLKSQNKMEDADWAKRQFDDGWKNPDLTLRIEDF